MEFISDLHVHSKYAGACSDQLILENMDMSARDKGIKIIGTGDFTHPLWFKDIKEKLQEKEKGIFTLKDVRNSSRFILSSEVCTIFYDKDVARKIHHCILAPDIETIEQINAALSKYGNLSSDGRPILNKIRPSELVEILYKINPDIFVFPAHAWTPWFGALGAFSGSDSIEEAYEDQAKHIHAFETGLSSDPAMNWRIAKLDKYAILSTSDAHSLPKLGREATVFELEEKDLSYKKLIDSIKKKQIKLTVEFYPEEGKYHYDGHRNCNVSLSPEDARKYNGICPKCRKRLTIGVMHRIEDLADRPAGEIPKGAAPFVNAIPLTEVLSFVSKKGPTSAYVKETYVKLIKAFGSEFNVLLKSDIGKIDGVDNKLAKSIERIRENKVSITPGYDGVFGIIDILDEVPVKKNDALKQSRITEF